MSRLHALGWSGAVVPGVDPTAPAPKAPNGAWTGGCPAAHFDPKSGWPEDLQAELLSKPDMNAQDLQEFVGKNAVFHLKLSEGRIGTVAGTLAQVVDGPKGLELRFDRLDPRSAQALGGHLFVPPDRTIQIRQGEIVDGVASAHGLGSLKGAPVWVRPPKTSHAGTQQVMRRAREIAHDPKAIDHADLAGLQKALSQPGQTPRAHAQREAAFGALKTERYAATAVLIDGVCRRALARPDMQAKALASLIDQAPDLQSGMKALEARIRDAFSEACQWLDAGAEAGTLPSPLDAAYAHAVRTLAMFEAAGLPVGGGLFVKTPADNIRAGVNTVSDALPGLLAMTMGLSPGARGPALSRRYGSCRHVVQELAKSDLSTLGHVLDHLRGDHEDGDQPFHFPPQAFELKGSGASAKVKLRDAVKDHVLEKFGASMDTPLETTKGCPALIGIQGPNALVQLVDRIAEAASLLPSPPATNGGSPDASGSKPSDPTAHPLLPSPSPSYLEEVGQTADLLDRWPQLHLYAHDQAPVRHDFARRLCRSNPKARLQPGPPHNARTLTGWLLHVAQNAGETTPVVVLDSAAGQAVRPMTRDQADALDRHGLVLIAPETFLKKLHPEQSQLFDSGSARRLRP